MSTNTAETTERYREIGNARLKLAAELKTPDEWKERWTPPKYKFPFAFGSCWNQCIGYAVEDYAAEIGFYYDVFGLSVNAFSADFAMFTSPEREFFFSVIPASEKLKAMPPECLDFGFMVKDLKNVATELEARGIVFSKPVSNYMDSPMLTGELETPNGIRITLWCFPEAEESSEES